MEAKVVSILLVVWLIAGVRTDQSAAQAHVDRLFSVPGDLEHEWRVSPHTADHLVKVAPIVQAMRLRFGENYGPAEGTLNMEGLEDSLKPYALTRYGTYQPANQTVMDRHEIDVATEIIKLKMELLKGNAERRIWKYFPKRIESVKTAMRQLDRANAHFHVNFWGGLRRMLDFAVENMQTTNILELPTLHSRAIAGDNMVIGIFDSLGWAQPDEGGIDRWPRTTAGDLLNESAANILRDGPGKDCVNHLEFAARLHDINPRAAGINRGRMGVLSGVMFFPGIKARQCADTLSEPTKQFITFAIAPKPSQQPLPHEIFETIKRFNIEVEQFVVHSARLANPSPEECTAVGFQMIRERVLRGYLRAMPLPIEVAPTGGLLRADQCIRNIFVLAART